MDTEALVAAICAELPEIMEATEVHFAQVANTAEAQEMEALSTAALSLSAIPEPMAQENSRMILVELNLKLKRRAERQAAVEAALKVAQA